MTGTNLPDRDAAWGVFRDGPDYQSTDRYDARGPFDAGWDAALAHEDERIENFKERIAQVERNNRALLGRLQEEGLTVPARAIDRDELLVALARFTFTGHPSDLHRLAGVILALVRPVEGVVIAPEDRAFIVDTLWAAAGVQRGSRISRPDFAERARALAERLEAGR